LINGGCLSIILKDDELSNEIKILFEKAESIIIYRSSPDEKA
jgi:hypothetical protein